jgi:hypothetical protein
VSSGAKRTNAACRIVVIAWYRKAGSGLLSVLLDMSHGCVVSVSFGLLLVAACRMSVMRGLLVISRLVVLCGLGVVLRGVGTVLRSLLMMFGRLFGHEISFSDFRERKLDGGLGKRLVEFENFVGNVDY